MDIMEVFKPDMYVTLCISNINLNSSLSAIEKSVNVSNRMFQSCLERHHKSEVVNIYYFLIFCCTCNVLCAWSVNQILVLSLVFDIVLNWIILYNFHRYCVLYCFNEFQIVIFSIILMIYLFVFYYELYINYVDRNFFF